MQGNIWVGTYYGGVNVFNPSKTSNHFYYAEPLQEDCLSFPVVGKMAEDSSGRLWICTDGGGLNCYNADTGIFTRYQHRKGDASSVGSNNLKSIFYRKENERLYVGAHLGGIFVLDLKSNKGHTLHNIVGDPTSLPHEIVNDIQEYKDGLALLTQGGVAFMDPVTEKFSPLSNDVNVRKLLNKRYAFETFLIDSRQRMWLASVNGGVICVDLPSSKITEYAMDTNNPSSIGRFKVVHIFEDSRGSVFFCTIGSGIYEYQEGEQSFKSYSTSNQCLPSDYCYYICESVEDHRLFILHGKGLSIFNREKGEVENTYHLFNQTYSQGSALYLDKNGTLFISGTNGLALFQKQSLYALPSKNLLNFDKLFIFNEEICPNDQSGILTDILAKTSDIYLSYKQNNITVEFASFNYNNDRNRLFEYRLEGFDKAWTQTTTGTTITYTNLPPGEYILRARPLAGKENLDEEVHLNIHVSAPFYATVWAYFFYLLCLLGVMIAFIRFKTRQAALKSSLEFERKEKERIEELNQVKLRFFTNISHEFRTPLTLILGQIEVLMQMDLGTTIYNRILRIYKNAWHMRNLISELLDFRKQEQGYLKLKVEEQNLVTFTRQIYMCFYEYAQKKEITYRFDNVEETISVWFDSKQLQKVIFNLLSNAFKYTPNKGSIRVEVRMLASQAIVSVCDTGVGIPEEHISKIFERFYQTDNSSSFTLGTGIGLALAKGIMNMHHGKIDVESTVGKGTKFTLSLPLGNRHFSDEEMATVESRESVIISEAVPMLPFEQIMDVEEEKTKVQENIKEEDKPIILLVDDNEELLSMLEDLFLPIYKVYIAHDGREGLEMARQIQPDLIISDVMMPEMSGKELCYKIKTNVELSHISVVLLTAQTSVEYVVEGLMFGADDYVTKPFNVKVLIARCNNLIKNKKRLIAHYAGKTITESPVTEAINERDKELLAKCVNIIKENFENPAFDVTALASELCVGRSKLYMQFKQMTGLTPNEFILKIKLDEAMSLLKNHPELNISEISIRLGFSSPRYFSKSFKAFFGVAPQTVRSRKKE
jgi:signal transduction histidine kinase/DNA-binding response OmpR family regulator/ligand-binding sensor domain-containing protein